MDQVFFIVYVGDPISTAVIPFPFDCPDKSETVGKLFYRVQTSFSFQNDDDSWAEHLFSYQDEIFKEL